MCTLFADLDDAKVSFLPPSSTFNRCLLPACLLSWCLLCSLVVQADNGMFIEPKNTVNTDADSMLLDGNYDDSSAGDDHDGNEIGSRVRVTAKQQLILDSTNAGTTTKGFVTFRAGAVSLRTVCISPRISSTQLFTISAQSQPLSLRYLFGVSILHQEH